MQWEKVRRVPTEALGGTGGGRVGGTPSRFPTSRRVLAKKPAFSASGLEKVPRDLKYPQKTAIAKCLETMRRPGRQRLHNLLNARIGMRWAMRTSSSHLRRSAFGRAALCMSSGTLEFFDYSCARTDYSDSRRMFHGLRSSAMVAVIIRWRIG
ncbi:unnamed protein product [Nesidiocoris tenuis]|uniref:Uncharacterized protein n=1 Tax=Nesidiocoris tenuis TaxID=355587 RepID=A0A6H5HLL3_9HEMI|nr:unnamed protein product [Nesidiocoris tenuis]